MCNRATIRNSIYIRLPNNAARKPFVPVHISCVLCVASPVHSQHETETIKTNWIRKRERSLDNSIRNE